VILDPSLWGSYAGTFADWEGEGVREPYYATPDGKVTLYAGDCREAMAEMPENSVDAIVTDPPYGLEFMGKEWDKLLVRERDAAYPSCRHAHGPNAYLAGMKAQEWHLTWAVAALRVLKPGGHALVFGGTRTFHRLTCALEDAGFEIRDCLSWNYGSGFPKSLDVSKAIDRAAGAERTEYVIADRYHDGHLRQEQESGSANISFGCDANGNRLSLPATEAARQWAGWGTALKPAWEPIILARKPLSGTVAANVQEWGTGAINIDGCRIGIEAADDIHAKNPHTLGTIGAKGIYGGGEPTLYAVPAGRWPANLLLDEEAGAMLDAQSGESASKATFRGLLQSGRHGGLGDLGANLKEMTNTVRGHGDSGDASRFFYCAKASSAERNGSKHPTVKPLDLIRYLCRLVTPPNGLILDPFAGSGTTLEAAHLEGFRCVGIEQSDEYCADVERRLGKYLL